MRQLIFSCVLVLMSNLLFGQYARFPNTGTVVYEKSINMYAILKKRADQDKGGFVSQSYEAYKKSQPQFKKVKSSLTFSGNKTFYTPLKNTEAIVSNFWSEIPAADQNNIIYTDLATGGSITQKSVFEETFLVKDSVRQINWKITDETRDIAGYPCRRANALILDSIYVVAFYTDKIPVSGGPESFTGLPGLILGVALPHENITWFATSVTDAPLTSPITAPKKGKATDYKGLVTILQGVMKSWGNYAQASLKAFLL